LGFNPSLRGDAISVTVPTYRLDVTAEIDLVEEVARLLGYDRIPLREQIEIRVAPRDPALAAEDEIRRALVGAGFYEAVTVTFVSDSLRDAFRPAGGLARADASVRKADAHLRPSLLPGLLECLARNEFVGVRDPRLFEIGSTFWLDASGELVERRQIAWVGNDLPAMRGTVGALLGRLDGERTVRVVPGSHPGLAGGAAGRIEWGDAIIGYVGLIDSAVSKTLDLRGRPAGAELLLEPLLAGARHIPKLKALPRFPGVERDLSLIVAEDVTFAALEDLVWRCKPKHLESVQFVTTYRGKPLSAGSKSVTLKLIFRAGETTLTNSAVDDVIDSVIKSAKSEMSATLRT
jgi:phenylalanyl-tRNA synthetase beta chain